MTLTLTETNFPIGSAYSDIIYHNDHRILCNKKWKKHLKSSLLNSLKILSAVKCR